MIDIYMFCGERGGFMHTRSPAKLDGFAHERDHKNKFSKHRMQKEQ